MPAPDGSAWAETRRRSSAYIVEDVATQAAQNVHSYEQILASSASGGRSLSHSSQFGRSSSTHRRRPSSRIVHGSTESTTRSVSLQGSRASVARTSSSDELDDEDDALLVASGLRERRTVTHETVHECGVRRPLDLLRGESVPLRARAPKHDEYASTSSSRIGIEPDDENGRMILELA